MRWKELKEFPGYEISETGVVRQGAKIIKTQRNSKGYLRFNKMIARKTHRRFIHRLVAESFIANPEAKPQVNHKDGDKSNNHYLNLEWVTCSENRQHAFDYGLQKSTYGVQRANAILTEDDVRWIRAHAKKHNPLFNFVVLGKRFGVHAQTIKNIVDGKKWRHVK